MRSSSALVPAAIPILALIGALPFVNHLEPVVLGLPFVLFWILAWVLATPVFMGVAYLLTRGSQPEAPGAAVGGNDSRPTLNPAPTESRR
jgi:hypothetical protein